MRAWALALLVGALVAPTAASPQDELARLARPWKRAAGWLSGEPAPPKRKRSRKLEGEHEGGLTAEEIEAEKEAELEEELEMKWGYVVGILALGVTFIGGYILEHNHITRMPEAGVGMIAGALAAAGAIATGHEHMAAHDQFDFEFFMTWLLPPIIFEAGYNMNVGAFVENMAPTMFFAFVGTFASTFIVGGIVWYAGQIGLCYPLGMLAALTFGSLISATDPVTVLAVFQALGVKVDLFSMVFGESVLNDAVAIVLSRTLLSFNKPGTEVNQESIMAAVVSFCTIFGGSLLIGAVYGVFSALVFKKLDLRHHSELVFMQSALSFAFPWAAYFTAEALELSGIVTILFCGMIMAVYTRYNFAEEARTLTAQGYKCVAVVAETFVFVYLGMAVFTFPIFNYTTWMLIACALLACFVGRLHIYVGSFLTNCFRSDDGKGLPKISGTYMFMMWFSGLRGGVAFALASVSYADMDFKDDCGGLAPEDREASPFCGHEGMSDSLAVLQTTLVIATFTIFVFGGLITELAVAGGVLEPKGHKAPAEKVEKTGCAADMRSWLTFNDHIQHELERQETGSRFEAAIEHQPSYSKVAVAPAAAGPGLSTAQIKAKLSEMEGTVGISDSTEDKIDELRAVFAGKPTSSIKKLLDAAGGDVQQAIILGQSKGFMD
jgi:sodium/hydrogen exchanger 8